MGITYTQFLIEQQRGKTVVFSFGRFNPPTIGHEKLIAAVAKRTKSYRAKDFFIFPSQSQDTKKNPLSFKQKAGWMKKAFPKYRSNIVVDTGIKTALDVAVKFHGKYDHLVMVVGSDRVTEFKKLLTTYNGKDSTHGYYEYKEIDVVSAGERDPDAEGAEGMSASKMRAAASKNDFDSFRKGVPSSLGDSDAKKMMDIIRKEMKLEMTLAKIRGEYISEAMPANQKDGWRDDINRKREVIDRAKEEMDKKRESLKKLRDDLKQTRMDFKSAREMAQ